MEKESLDFILLDYLRRVISALKVDFGSLILIDREKKMISMARIGEFEFGNNIFENSEMDNFFSTMKEGKPQIRVKEMNRSFLNFKKNKIKSEMIFSLELKDGKIALFFLPSFEKEYFKEEHVNSVKKILEEIKIKIENISENRKSFILYKYKIKENILENLLGGEFKIVSIPNIKRIKNTDIGSAEFIIIECPSKCSMECGKLFLFLNENKKPFGILRPIELRKSGEVSFFCTFYKPSFKSVVPEKIPKFFQSLKNSLRLQISWSEKRLLDLLSFLEKMSIDDSLSNLKTVELAKLINFSRSFFSVEFKKITGKSLKEFITQLKMCNSLYYLSMGKSVGAVSHLLGYKSRTAFIDKFKKYFGVCPSFLKHNKNLKQI